MSANDRQPLYVAIQRDIERAIMSGDWPPGFRVPSEHELLAQYACSRMTVNKALSALAAAGLIIRKRRSGSFVAPPQSEETILEIHDIREEILASGKSYHYELVDCRVRRASAVDARRLGIEVEAEVVAIQARHIAGGRPFVVEDRLINLAAVPKAARRTLHRGAGRHLAPRQGPLVGRRTADPRGRRERFDRRPA